MSHARLVLGSGASRRLAVSSVALIVFLVSALQLSAPAGAQAPPLGPPWTGELPPPGGVALLGLSREVERPQLLAWLRDEGCRDAIVGITQGGSWIVYRPNAPAFVNAAFPGQLASGRPFVVLCGPADTPVTLRQEDAGSSVRLDVHDELVVRLPANPSTGYAWRVEPALPGTVLTQVGEPGFEPSSDLLGAPGVSVFNFIATGPGQVELRLIEDRVFEDTPPLNEWSVLITVRGQQAVAWLGEVRTQPAAPPGARYLQISVPDLPEGAVPPGVGIRASDGATANAIEALTDTGEAVLVWGELTCGVVDYGNCRIDATTIIRLTDTPSPVSSEVVGWAGTVGSVTVDGVARDYFQLQGDLPIQHGVAGATAAIEQQLQEARTTGQAIRIQGELTAPADDVNRSRITVTEVALVP